MKKRIVAMMLTGMMIVTLNGCGRKEIEQETEKTEINETAKHTANEIKEDKKLVIPISNLSEKATFYPVEVDGAEMEVIAGKDSKGEIRTAFNTCQVCYDSGNGYYRQLGDELVCQNCGNSFTMDVIGKTAGGCNPVPILEENRTVTDSEIQISYEFLKESSDIFANWKIKRKKHQNR